MSRSSSVVVAYLASHSVEIDGKLVTMSVDEAAKYMEEKRRVAKPSAWFLAQIKEWDAERQGQLKSRPTVDAQE